jgi:iron complex outermembrane receptor protein
VPYDEVNKQFIRLPRSQNLTVHDKHPAVNDITLLGVNWSHQFNDDWEIKQQIMQNKVDGSYGGYYGVWGFTQVGPTSWTADRHRTSLEGTDTITSTDINLTGHFDTAGLKHTLLLGTDYYLRDMSYNYGYSSFPPSLGSVTDAFNPTPPVGVPFDPSTFSWVDNTTKNYGAYIQDQIKLPHDVQLLAGLRYQKVTHTGSTRDFTGAVTPDDKQNDHDVTPRVGILWQPQNWLSLYGNYAENFGANNGRDVAGKTLDPESAKQKEVGAKAEFFGGKLRANLAIFNLTKQNVASADPVNLGFQVAVGEVRSKGTEFDIQGEILPGWDVIATHTYTDISVIKSTPGSNFTEGNRMPNVPRNMASFSTTYKFHQEALSGLKIGGGVIYRSSTTNASNTIETPGYTIFDAMAAYEFKAAGHKMTAQLNIYNLFNKEYDMEMDAFGNFGILTYGAPRSATASLKFEY